MLTEDQTCPKEADTPYQQDNDVAPFSLSCFSLFRGVQSVGKGRRRTHKEANAMTLHSQFFPSTLT